MELPKTQKEKLCEDIMGVLGRLDWMNATQLIALVMANATLKEQVAATLISYVTKQLRAEVRFQDWNPGGVVSASCGVGFRTRLDVFFSPLPEDTMTSERFTFWRSGRLKDFNQFQIRNVPQAATRGRKSPSGCCQKRKTEKSQSLSES